MVDVENAEVDSEVRDKDLEMKNKGKEYEDRKRRVEESNIRLVEKVYIKNMTKDNKLTTEFNPATHTVLSKEGSDVNVRNDETGQQYRRNVVHLKRVEGQWKICKDGEETEFESKIVICGVNYGFLFNRNSY